MFSDIFPFVLIVAIGFLVHYQHEPNVQNYEGSFFNETRALENLLQFSKQIGPRVVGTIQEKQASEFIMSKLKSMETCLSKISKPQIIQKLHSGANSIKIGKNPAAIISYSNITNIIMYLHPLSSNYTDAFMVSSHYDSGISSPGFYDDGVPVVVSLEVLQNLCDKNAQIKHPLIFLFNAAEEMGLLGSSAFMKDETSKDMEAFINLEAAGTGGRNFIFQAGNSWIMKQFMKSVKNVKGNVLGQDVFELKIIPSDTDYKVYKLKENCVGIDTAFYQNGHVYHTRGDSFETFEKGSILHMGENVEMFTEHMATFDSKYNSKKGKSESPVFFDVLSSKLFVYSIGEATNLNFIIFFIIVIYISMECSKGILLTNLLKSCFFLVISLLTSIIFSLGTAFVLLNILKAPMFWYSMGSKYCVAFYSIPTLIGFFISLRLFSGFTRDEVYLSVMLFWDGILLFLTCSQVGTSFIPLIFSLCLFVGHVIRNSPSFVVITIPSIILLDCFFILIEVFSAIMGRSYSDKADYVISVMVSFVSFLLLTLLIPFLHKSKNSRMFASALFITLVVIVARAPLISPYSNERPKRVLIQHVINIENETSYDSFVAISSSDAISLDIVPSLKNMEDKNLTIYPIPTLGPPSSKTNWIFKSIPTSNDTSIAKLASIMHPKLRINRNDTQIFVNIDSHIDTLALHIEIETGCKFKNWTIPIKMSKTFDDGKYRYKFRHIHGYHDLDKESKNFQFSLDQKNCTKNSTKVYLKLASFFIHESLFSDTMKYSLNVMPDWTSPSGIMVSVLNKTI